MRGRKLKARLLFLLTAVSVSIVLFTLSTSLLFASGISITMVNHYPVDGETYEFVDHFFEQTTAVNTNTTVSVSIDGGSLIPMMYRGIRNEIVSGDTTARDWHTWNLTISAIDEPGAHTFQFFRHYYVWQEADQYWAEFNSHSTVMSFNLAESSAMPSPPPGTINPIFILTVITASIITAFLVLVMFTLRKHNQKNSRADRT